MCNPPLGLTDGLIPRPGGLPSRSPIRLPLDGRAGCQTGDPNKRRRSKAGGHHHPESVTVDFEISLYGRIGCATHAVGKVVKRTAPRHAQVSGYRFFPTILWIVRVVLIDRGSPFPHVACHVQGAVGLAPLGWLPTALHVPEPVPQKFTPISRLDPVLPHGKVRIQLVLRFFVPSLLTDSLEFQASPADLCHSAAVGSRPPAQAA